ncbi:MAG: thioredoxin family protein [Peptococcaceae bacterium]|nr:thioredoxin family protein [Peptococcaceae bacterium]
MKKIFLGIFIAGVAISLIIFWRQSQTGLPAGEVDPQELKRMVAQGGDFFVYFYSPACPDCKKAEPKIARAVEVAGVKMVKLNVDEYKDIKNELQIAGTPTIYHYRDQKLVSGITGDFPDGQKYVEYFLKGSAPQ